MSDGNGAQSAHEALVDSVVDILQGRGLIADDADADAVLAEVFRTLETVPPEMFDAWLNAVALNSVPTDLTLSDADADWLAMLRASPLNPGEPAS
jgi:hypothetical protein